MKNIVIIGGGTGTFTLLSGLRQFPSNNSVIVSTADDGGSTGRLRKDLGVVPPGDIRQCLVGLSYTDESLRSLFSYRFDKGELAGHTVGNIILAGLEKINGSVEDAIAIASKLLNVRGEVVPVTMHPTLLTAVLEDGKKIVGEHAIDSPRAATKSIKSLQLTPNGPANKHALELISRADVIVLGPGDLYTSTLPNLLVKGVVEAIKKSKAKKVLVANIMSKNGQTDGFQASNFVKVLQELAGKGIVDSIIVNTKKPEAKILARYKKNKAEFIEPDVAELKALGVKVIAEPLLAKEIFKKAKGDTLERSFVRHDAVKTARLIWELI
jgi:uncharacterized cofD-like protein